MIRVIGMHTLVGCVALLAAVACAPPPLVLSFPYHRKEERYAERSPSRGP